LGNHFLPKAREAGLASIDELNAAVLEWLATVDHEELREFCQTRSERFEAERSALQSWIEEAAPDIRSSHDLSVSREGTISFESNRYSVPADLIGKMVCLRQDPLTRTATIYHDGKELYSLTLLSSGGRGRLIRPQDAKSLRARWERENRRSLSQDGARPERIGEPKPEGATVETRHPACFDRLMEGA
jgi:hypothetical protein